MFGEFNKVLYLPEFRGRVIYASQANYFPDAYAIEPMWGALGSLPYVGCTRNKLDKLKDTSKILNPCNPSSDIVSMVVELQT